MDTKEFITSELQIVDREGMPDLLKYLEESNYFIDPASANHHNNYEGGLADHSLNVYHILKNYQRIYPELEKLEDSLRIIGFLHNLSYVGAWQKTSRNVPMRGSDGKYKKDEQGKKIWIEKETWDFFPESRLPYLKGQLSAIMIKQYLKLTKLEDLAINWQRGIYDVPRDSWSLADRAMKTHKLIFLTQMAKKEACLFNGEKTE